MGQVAVRTEDTLPDKERGGRNDQMAMLATGGPGVQQALLTPMKEEQDGRATTAGFFSHAQIMMDCAT